MLQQKRGPHGEKMCRDAAGRRTRATAVTDQDKPGAAHRGPRLLQADAGATDDAIAGALRVRTATVEGLGKHFVEHALEVALPERSQPGS